MLLNRPGKTDPRSETRTERPGPIPDPTPEICLPKMDPKSELTQTEPYPTQNFLQSCLSWYDKRIWPKISRPEIDPNRTISDPNRNDLKSHLATTWPDPNLTRPVPKPNDPFARSTNMNENARHMMNLTKILAACLNLAIILICCTFLDQIFAL